MSDPTRHCLPVVIVSPDEVRAGPRPFWGPPRFRAMTSGGSMWRDYANGKPEQARPGQHCEPLGPVTHVLREIAVACTAELHAPVLSVSYSARLDIRVGDIVIEYGQRYEVKAVDLFARSTHLRAERCKQPAAEPAVDPAAERIKQIEAERDAATARAAELSAECGALRVKAQQTEAERDAAQSRLVRLEHDYVQVGNILGARHTFEANEPLLATAQRVVAERDRALARISHLERWAQPIINERDRLQRTCDKLSRGHDQLAADAAKAASLLRLDACTSIGDVLREAVRVLTAAPPPPVVLDQLRWQLRNAQARPCTQIEVSIRIEPSGTATGAIAARAQAGG